MSSEICSELEEALAELPMFDVHTHLVGGHLGAGGSREGHFFALPHGRRRIFTRAVAEQGAADAIPRLAERGRSPAARRQGNSVSSDDRRHELLVGTVDQ